MQLCSYFSTSFLILCFIFLPSSFPFFLPSFFASLLFFFFFIVSIIMGRKTHETLTRDLKPSMKTVGEKKKKTKNYMYYISPIHSAIIVTEGNGNTPDLVSPVSPVKNLPYSTICKFRGNLGNWCPPSKSRSLCYLVLSYAVPCNPPCKHSLMSKFYIFFLNIYIYILAVLGLHWSIWASL